MKLQEFSHLKNIPGYKTILQAVLKTQIQLLVDHLHEQTGEEALILTASTKDGTMCFLGSDTGQGFLEGREEIKSQFLAHCISETSPHSPQMEQYPLYYRNFDSHSLQESLLSSSVGIHQKRKHSPCHNTQLFNSFPDISEPAPKTVCAPVTDLSHDAQDSNSLVPGMLSNTFTTQGNQSLPTFSLQAVLINAGKCTTGQDSNKIMGCLENRDKNKKTLSSKIEEITERIRTKDEIFHNKMAHEDSVESSILHKLDASNDFMTSGSSDEMRGGLAPVLSDGHRSLDTSGAGKIKDVSRASHRKPKLPRFNIGEESDEEDNNLSRSSGTSLVDNILDIPVSMDSEDGVFSQISLDEIGEGVLLKESVTDIPIVAYDNGHENNHLDTNHVSKSIENAMSSEHSSMNSVNNDSSIGSISDGTNVNLSMCNVRTRGCKSDMVIVSGSFSEKRWVKCTMCPEKFTTQDALNCHLQKVAHTPKKYECDFCGRKFNQLRDMARHRRIHTGERPFTCDICNKSFARKDNLKSHKVKHFKQSPVMRSILRPDLVTSQDVSGHFSSATMS